MNMKKILEQVLAVISAIFGAVIFLGWRLKAFQQALYSWE